MSLVSFYHDMTKEKGKIYLQCEFLSDVFDRGMQPKEGVPQTRTNRSVHNDKIDN